MFHMDGWRSYLTSLGRGGDKSQALEPTVAIPMTWPDLTNIYMGDGIGARIVDVVAEDMTRNGFEINGDDKGDLSLICKNLLVKSVLHNASKWTRLYGGALVLLETSDDEDSMLKPLPSKYKINALKVYPASRVILTLSDFNLYNPKQPYYNEPYQYHIFNRWTGKYFTVHRSRCIPIKGRVAPDYWNNVTDINVRYWGVSVLQFCRGSLSGTGAFMQGLAHLGQEMTIGKFKLHGLAKLLAEKNYKDVMKRMSLIHTQKSTINAVIMGEDEEYSRDSLTFTGVGDAVDRFFMWIAGETGVPTSRIFGPIRKGLGDSDEGDARNYYDMVKSDQESSLQPPALELVAKINTSVGTIVKEDILGITWNPIWTPSQAQDLDMRLKQAQIDLIYVNQTGSLTGDEVRTNRFMKGYSFETSINGDSVFSTGVKGGSAGGATDPLENAPKPGEQGVGAVED
jgi:uncharacterized protein